MTPDHLSESLLAIAKQLRPVTRSPYISLVNLAKNLGVIVELRFHTGTETRVAQSDLNRSQPKIFLYRKSSTEGILRIASDKEYLLTPRERFSIAHELGHFLAFKNLNAPPVLKEADPAEYRRQERCMDHFAESLLVPEWLVKLWLMGVSDQEPISLEGLKKWSVAQCGVSGEVVASALARVEPKVGFLKAAEAVRRANGKNLFIVLYSVHGTDLQLPNLHSYIDDERFVDKIRGTSGCLSIDDCHLGNVKCENLNLAWHRSNIGTSRRRREFHSKVQLSGKGYWISIRLDRCCDYPGTQRQLQLNLF